jgi:hypothetical protein
MEEPTPEPEVEIETVSEGPALIDAPQPETDFAAPDVVESSGPVYLSTEQPKRVSDFDMAEEPKDAGIEEPSDVEEPADEEPSDVEEPADEEVEDKEEE